MKLKRNDHENWCACGSDLLDELMSLPKGAFMFSAEEKRALLDKGDQDILNYYGVKARQDVQ